jgi:hypothetical protein
MTTTKPDPARVAPGDTLVMVETKHAVPSRAIERLTAPVGGQRVASAALGGLIATAAWIALFTAGLAVPSQPFRDGLLSLAGGAAPPGAVEVAGLWGALRSLGVIAVCYTPTNLATLCCLASLVGCLASTATNAPAAAPRADEPAIPLRPAICAITWGFFIYLLMISGMLLAVESPFASTSPDQYLRLAGTASLLAFVAGWRPELIARLVAHVGDSKLNARDDRSRPAQ